MNGIELIAKERLEQINKHGRTLDHDASSNTNNELKKGAIGLLDDNVIQRIKNRPIGWNDTIWNKMCVKSYEERLIIAGAFIAAELDRIII